MQPTVFSRRLFLSALIVCAFAGLTIPLSLSAEETVAPTVRLEIDYNNGVQKIYILPWKTGMTVFDALKAAEASNPGITFKFDKTGGNDTIFIKEIDGFLNQGSGADKKNWMFWVNKKFADKSCGAYELKKSDVTTWRFDVWKEEAKKGE